MGIVLGKVYFVLNVLPFIGILFEVVFGYFLDTFLYLGHIFSFLVVADGTIAKNSLYRIRDCAKTLGVFVAAT